MRRHLVITFTELANSRPNIYEITSKFCIHDENNNTTLTTALFCTDNF